MRCQEVQIQLRAFSLGELPTDIRQTVRDHLSTCDVCRGQLAQIDPLAGVLTAMQTPSLPEGFAARVLSMARQRQETEQIKTWNLVRWWRLTSVPMHAAAAAVMVIGLAVGLLIGQASAPLPPQAAGQVQPDPVDAYLLDYLGEAPSGSLADSYFALAATTSGGGR